VAVEDAEGRKNKSVLLYTAGDLEYKANDRKYKYTVIRDDCKVRSYCSYNSNLMLLLYGLTKFQADRQGLHLK